MKEPLLVVNAVPDSNTIPPDDRRFESLTSISDKIDVDPEKIAAQMNRLIEVFEHVNAQAAGAYELSTVDIELVVTASGKLAILGSGIEGGAKAGIRAKISKREIEKG
jgi:hypothetical protein